MANAQIESLRMTLQSVQAAVDALEDVAVAQEAQIASLTTERDAALADVLGLSSQVAEKNATISQLEAERDAALAKLSIFQVASAAFLQAVTPHLPLPPA